MPNRVSSDANKIHNALDQAFGETLVKAAAGFSNMVGGVDNLTGAISMLARCYWGWVRR